MKASSTWAHSSASSLRKQMPYFSAAKGSETVWGPEKVQLSEPAKASVTEGFQFFGAYKDR
mgnify:CR=1 FL=1